jgi:hypothetical protein
LSLAGSHVIMRVQRDMDSPPTHENGLIAWLAKKLEEGVVVALLMAFIATLGALAAFRTASIEQDSSKLENTLNQSQIVELTKRQEYMDRYAQYGRFYDDYTQHVSDGKRLANEAEQYRVADRALAARRDVEAEVQFNIARILRPYLSVTSVPLMTSELTSDQLVEKNVARDLQQIGFPSQSAGPGSSADVPMWQAQLDAIRNTRNKLVSLTWIVVVFVSALGCLTLAELWRKKHRRLILMFALGFLIAAGGVIATIRIDVYSGPMFLWTALAFTALGFLGRLLAPWMVKIARKLSIKFGFLGADEREDEGEEEDQHPGEVDPLLFPGARVHSTRPRNPLAIQVIMLIVVTVLLSAVLGCAYGKANGDANSNASKADDHLVDSFKTSHSGFHQYALGGMAIGQEQQVAYKAELQQLDLARLGLLKIDPQQVEEDTAHWKNLVDSQRQDMLQLLNGEDGTELDPQYPLRFMRGWVRQESETAFAQSNAENELSLAYHDRAHWYLTTLTFLAIALYLFGQSLTMIHQLKAAGTLLFFGMCLVAAGTGIAAVQGAKKLPGRAHAMKGTCVDKNQPAGDPGSEAARDYANGIIEYNLASTQDDFGEAARDFGCAVDARPAFALANYYLARASTNQATPQDAGTFVSVVSEDKISEIVSHERIALDGLVQNGLVLDADRMGNFGFDNYLLGLVQKNRKRIKSALKETHRAILLDPEKQLSFLRFNLGLMQLAVATEPRRRMRTPGRLASRPRRCETVSRPRVSTTCLFSFTIAQACRTLPTARVRKTWRAASSDSL